MEEPGGFEREFARVEALMRDWSLEEATRILEALERAGGFPNRLRHDLSVLHAQQGFFAEALAQVEAALALEPDNRALWHHYLAIQKNNPRQPSPREWRAMHLAFGDTLRDRHDERHLAVARVQGRRLRVGLLCPDTHLATGRFVWPLLEHLPPGEFEVFAYWAHATDPVALQREYPRAVHRLLRGLDDAGIVELLLRDAIDIAIDIAGHGSGNVLTALARRPAPVALTWLDYLATTGMREVDFRVTDAVADPAGAEEAHVERLLRLDRAQWCYRPPPAAGDAAVEQRAQRPGVVFGSVSVPLKLSDPILETWGRLLHAVPHASLRFLGIPEGRARERIVERLHQAGIERARIELEPRLDQGAFLRALTQMDVVLDTWPFSGATSTLDALWQGVPVVTWAGPLSHGRSTASILATLGRGQWVAGGADDFVRIAAGLAADPAGLDRERHALRAQLAASPLCDGRAFASAMGRAFHEAWASRPTGSVDAKGQATAFWQDVKASGAPAGERKALGDLAEVIDLASADARERVAASPREWILLTHSGHFDSSTIASTIPAEALTRFDLLAALGSDALVNGDLTAAGQGHASGARIVAEGERLYVSAWAPEAMGRCVALSGGALLLRRQYAIGWDFEDAAGASAFSRQVARVSHRLFQGGARLGVLAGLAAAEKSWPTVRDEWAAHRALERDLGLARWGQQQPAARALKVVLTRAGWDAIRGALEARCGLPPG